MQSISDVLVWIRLYVRFFCLLGGVSELSDAGFKASRFWRQGDHATIILLNYFSRFIHFCLYGSNTTQFANAMHGFQGTTLNAKAVTVAHL